MTFDKSDTKMWFDGEYLPLDAKSRKEKMRQFKEHCGI